MANQRDIAKYLGLSQTTVSFALRGHSKVPESTRLEVLKAAEKLNYRPNPMVSSLMQRIQEGKKVTRQGCIAVIADARDMTDWLTHIAYEEQFNAIKEQAKLRGYGVEVFFLRQDGLSSERLDQILYARGINGLILANSRYSNSQLSLQWERYACVCSGYSWLHPVVDRVSAHQRHHVEKVYHTLQSRGYRRIAFCLPEEAIPRQDGNFLAGWLMCQYRTSKTSQIPLFTGSPERSKLSEFKLWFQKHKPDALISLNANESEWLESMDVELGRDLGFVCLGRRGNPDFSGINENNALIGQTLCDLLSANIMHNERGVPKHPQQVFIEGNWVEGTTAPEIASTLS